MLVRMWREGNSFTVSGNAVELSHYVGVAISSIMVKLDYHVVQEPMSSMSEICERDSFSQIVIITLLTVVK